MPFLALEIGAPFPAAMGKAKDPSFSHRARERGSAQKKKFSNSWDRKFERVLALEEANMLWKIECQRIKIDLKEIKLNIKKERKKSIFALN